MCLIGWYVNVVGGFESLVYLYIYNLVIVFIFLWYKINNDFKISEGGVVFI